MSWRIDGNRLVRREVLEAEQDVSITKWRVAIPSTASSISPSDANKRFVLSGREGKLGITIDAPFAQTEIQAMGDSDLGKGVLGAIPLNVVLTSGERQLRKGEKLVWEVSLEIVE